MKKSFLFLTAALVLTSMVLTYALPAKAQDETGDQADAMQPMDNAADQDAAEPMGGEQAVADQTETTAMPMDQNMGYGMMNRGMMGNYGWNRGGCGSGGCQITGTITCPKTILVPKTVCRQIMVPQMTYESRPIHARTGCTNCTIEGTQTCPKTIMVPKTVCHEIKMPQTVYESRPFNSSMINPCGRMGFGMGY